MRETKNIRILFMPKRSIMCIIKCFISKLLSKKEIFNLTGT